MALPVINNPCPEKWEGMTPDEHGRFCGKCAKIVIDFTKKTTQEIVDFLNARKGEDICGKMRPVTVNVTSPPRNFSRLRIFAAALYLSFGSLLFTSCGNPDEEPMGKVRLDSATEANNQHYFDSMSRADSIAKSKTSTEDTGTIVLDTAGMNDALRAIDSIAKLRKK